MYLLSVLCCVCGVLSHWAPDRWCACSVCCVVCSMSLATWLMLTGVPARYVALRVRCPWSLSSSSPVCTLSVLCVRCPLIHGSCTPMYPLSLLCCACGVLGDSAPDRWCARSVCCDVCAVSLATRLMLTGVPARYVALRVRCAACAVSVATLLLFTTLQAPCVVCAVSLASWVLFAGVPACCVVLRARCPWPLGSCSAVCQLGVLCVRCPRALGSCSSLCPLGLFCCVYGVLGHLAPVHRCYHSVCCVACAVSFPTWLLFTGVPAGCVVLCVWCPWALGSCSPLCMLGVLTVRFPWPVGSCAPVSPLGVLCCVCVVLAQLAPVQRCARWVCCMSAVLGHWAADHRCASLVCCVVYAVSLATWLLFTAVHARCAVCAMSLVTCLLFTSVPTRCVVVRVRFSRPLGACSQVCPGCVVLHVRCPLPLCACSPVCWCGVFCVVCCGVLRFCVSAMDVPCAQRARAPYAPFSLWCVFLRFVAVPCNLVLYLGLGWMCASLACLVALRRCAVPRLVRSLSVRRCASSPPSPTRGLRPWIYWVAARGTFRSAENRAHGSCRCPPLWRGRWPRSTF